MAAGQLRAFRTYGTNANLRSSLAQFHASGGGFCASLAPGSHSRISGLAESFDSVQDVPFERFVARCLSLRREAMLPAADGIQEREALARACRSLPPESPFYACREHGGFVRRLAATLRELRLWRWAPDEMRRLSSECEPWLRAKLESLAQLEEGVRAGLRSAARELATERMERCLRLGGSAERPFRLWVYAGGEFAPIWADWLRWAAQTGNEVWLVVDGHPGSDRVFRGASRMVKAVRAHARWAGGANALADGLFASQGALDPGIAVRVLSVADPLAEAEWALRSLAESAEDPDSKGRVAIYVRSLDDYALLLHAAAERLGIVLRMARRERVSENPWFRFLMAFLQSCAESSPRGLAKLASSSYLGLPPESAALCREAISLACGESDPWSGWAARMDGANAADKWSFEAVRLHDKAEMGPIPLQEWRDELTDLVDADWLETAFQTGSPTRARDTAARAALLHALEQRAALAEDGEEADLPSFLEELKRIASQCESGVGPGEEGIPVVASTYGLGSAETVCVLGMVEGVFPRRRSEDPILSDFERAEISARRPEAPALPSSHDVAAAERDELIRLCAAPTRELNLFYPQVGDDRDNTPAFYLTELKRAAGARFSTREAPSARLAPLGEECRFAADMALRAALDGPRLMPSEPELLEEASRELARGLPEDGLSPSELRDALRCPFQFLFRRKLGIRPGPGAPAWHRLRFLPEAVRLPALEDRASASAALERALAEEIESLESSLEPAERRLLEAGGRREVRGWVDREFTARELWRKEPPGIEAGVAFGEAGTAGDLPVRGGSLKLRGRWAAVGDLQGLAVGQVYGARSFGGGRNLDKLEDPDFLELGLYLWSLCKRRKSVALELDTASGERLLMVLPKPEELRLESRVGEGVRVVDLGEKQPFFERVKGLLGEAVERIERGEMRPKPGEHCRTCDYGELCRRAQGWGEGFDPFSEGVGDDR
jgi:hypothetical protein